MEKTPLYEQIAESIRQEILYGTLQPDDELPTVREMAERWGCAPGTVQHAYKDLAEQGLLVSRPGRGTRVATTPPSRQAPLRKAALINQAETFLLGALTGGYSAAEIEQAFHLALDRWRTAETAPERRPAGRLRFVGSHDPALSLLAARLSQHVPHFELHLTFAGSLGGLMALARHDADLAGCHLWDEATDSYNKPFVQHLLPGRRMALVTVAGRRLGLITAPGNPLQIEKLADLVRPDVRFVNRQEGAGTRVWLKAQLGRMDISVETIAGFEEEVLTHSAVAGAIQDGRADVGVGIEAAALAYGLAFVPLTTERYDLVIPAAVWEMEAAQELLAILNAPEMKTTLKSLGGYLTKETGHVTWVS